MSTALAVPKLAEAVAERTLARPRDAALEAAVGQLVAAAGESLVGLVFFGSRRTGAARVDAWSAYDLFMVVSAYRPFYAALRRAGFVHRPAWLMAFVSRILPPTQLSLRFDPPGLHVKGSVIDARAFVRATGPWIGRVLARTAARRSGDAGPRPPEAAIAALRSRIWAEARNDQGQAVVAMLETGEGYRAAASTAVRAVESLLQAPRIGALTPVQAFGADFALGAPATRIQELQP